MKFENLAELQRLCINLDRAEERDVFTKHETGLNGEDFMIKSEKHLGIWNLDTDKLSCIASERYKIIQHREAFEEMIEVFRNLNMDLSGKVINRRDRVDIEAIFKGQPKIQDDKDGILLGVKFSNSYNLSKSFTGELYAYRLVCKNGMILGSAINDVKLRRYHIGDIKIREELIKFVKSAITSSTKLNELVSNAMEHSVEWDIARKMLETDFSKKIVQQISDRISNFNNVTRWDIYNALTNLATHDKELSIGMQEWIQSKAQKILVKMPEVV